MTKQIIFLPLFLLITATTFQFGYFSLPGLAVVVISFVFFLLLFFRNKFTENLSQRHFEYLPLIFIIIYTLFIFFSGGIYQERVSASMALHLIPLALFPLVLTFTVKLPNTFSFIKNRFKILLLFALFLRILIIMASPSPRIDTYVLLKEAPQALLSGRNPYETIYSKVYQNIEPNYYSYWPASFLLEVPFVTIFSDPRILLILADISAAILIYLLGKKTVSSELLSLIYLFRPNSLFIIEQSWLTPLAFFFIALSFYLISRMKVRASAMIWGLLAGLKPDYILAIPFLWFSTKFDKKAILIFIFTLAISVLPFFLLQPDKFLSQTIFLYLLPFDKIPIPVHLSLNLNTLYFQLIGKDIPFIVSGLFSIVLFSSIFYRLYKNLPLSKIIINARAGIILGMTVMFFGVYLIFRMAFINYYYFLTGLYILWLASSININKS